MVCGGFFLRPKLYYLSPLLMRIRCPEKSQAGYRHISAVLFQIKQLSQKHRIVASQRNQWAVASDEQRLTETIRTGTCAKRVCPISMSVVT